MKTHFNAIIVGLFLTGYMKTNWVQTAVLTDFGMCFDFLKFEVIDFKVEMKYDGFRRGGAIITQVSSLLGWEGFSPCFASGRVSWPDY